MVHFSQRILQFRINRDCITKILQHLLSEKIKQNINTTLHDVHNLNCFGNPIIHNVYIHNAAFRKTNYYQQLTHDNCRSLAIIQ